MASVKFYTLIYVALIALASGKFLFFEFFDYWVAVGGTIGLAIGKTMLIVGYFQHLRSEPRSLSYLMALSLALVLLLVSAASYSIT
ncbi:MAG: cytochrome C oxidase subunit IV family protein [Halobacteriota archaeon]